MTVSFISLLDLCFSCQEMFPLILRKYSKRAIDYIPAKRTTVCFGEGNLKLCGCHIS